MGARDVRGVRKIPNGDNLAVLLFLTDHRAHWRGFGNTGVRITAVWRDGRGRNGSVNIFQYERAYDEDIGAAFHHLAKEVAPEGASFGVVKPSVHFPEGIVCRI